MFAMAKCGVMFEVRTKKETKAVPLHDTKALGREEI
jgi:hypothetical protein